MRSWASNAILGSGRRDALLRAALAIILLGAVFWLLPLRRAGEDGGHHGGAPALDPFEKAGVVELKEGQKAPALALATLDGGRTTLADHRGKLVVLNFWATWCQPCALEMPSLEALWRRYRDRGLVVVAVSVDRGSPRHLLEPYVRNLKLTFPILLDPDAKKRAHPSMRWAPVKLPGVGHQSAGEVREGRSYCTTISTRRFCGSRTPSPVCTSRPCSPRPITLIAWAGTPSRTRASFTALARRSDSAML